MEKKKKFYLSLKMRLLFLLFVIVIPLTFMVAGYQRMFENYSRSYNEIMANLKVANEYNIKFKSDMEYSMYRVMIGLIDVDKFENGDILEGKSKYATVVKNPLNMIASARHAFGKSIERVPGSDGDIKIKGILSCLDSLEKAVNRMIDNASVTGRYDENVNIWENDIQGLCSMIQDYITQYTYYEMINMEQLQKELEQQVTKRIQEYMVLLACVLTAGTFLALAITNSITGPLGRLQQTAERLGKGDLDAKADLGSLEEINVLARTFNHMSERIRRLLEKNTQEQKNLREAELRLHQEQISPHFLYNTLDTIVWLIEGGMTDDAVEMISSLSIFFRTSLSKGNDIIPLAEEKRHTLSYLEIQQFRYHDILEFELSIPKEMDVIQVPKLSIQPLAENALYHGIKNRRGKGKITITGREEENAIVLTVSDNGQGMTPERLHEVQEAIRTGERAGFGLAAVAERIALYYGPGYGMTISSKEGEGTTVELRLGKNIQPKS